MDKSVEFDFLIKARELKSIRPTVTNIRQLNDACKIFEEYLRTRNEKLETNFKQQKSG